MPERITKTQRWLDLIALLLGRRVPLAVEEIMERVPAYAEGWQREDEKSRATVRRMFERDKDELRAIGIPIEIVPYTLNFGAERIDGYRITRRDFYLPYLKLLDRGRSAGGRESAAAAGVGAAELDEAAAEIAVEALRRVAELPDFPFEREARSALNKLTFDLDPERFSGAAVSWVAREEANAVLDRLRPLTDALLARKRVRFRYAGIRRGGEFTERDVAPYGLFFQRDWYLVGHDALRDAIRVFRVSRMSDLRPNTAAPKSRDFEVPESFDLKALVGRRAWELSDETPETAEVRFHFPSSLWVERNAEGNRIRDEEGGAVVRSFQVADEGPFLRWLLGFAGEVEVLSPAPLREAYLSLATAVAQRHEGPHA